MSPTARRWTTGLLVGLCVLLSSGSSWCEPGAAGNARRVTGTALILRPGQPDYMPLKEGDPVHVQDMLVTDPSENSKAWLHVAGPQSGDVSLGRNSAFSVLGLETQGPAAHFAGQVAKGMVRFRKALPSTNPPSSFAVFSPTALVAVMSTREEADFVVESLDEVRTTVTVIKGEVTVSNVREDLAEARLLRACQAVTVEKDKVPSRIMRVSAEYMKELIAYTTIPNTLPTDVPSCDQQSAMPESPLPYDYYESFEPNIIVVPGPNYFPLPIPVPVPVWPTVPTWHTFHTLPTTPTMHTLPTRHTIPTHVTVPTRLTIPTRVTLRTLPTLQTFVTLPTARTFPTFPTLRTLPTFGTLPTAVTFPSIRTLRTFPTFPTLRTIPTFATIRTFPTFPTRFPIPTQVTVPGGGLLPTVRTLRTVTPTQTIPTSSTGHVPTLRTLRTVTPTQSISTVSTGHVPTMRTIRTVTPTQTIHTQSEKKHERVVPQMEQRHTTAPQQMERNFGERGTRRDDSDGERHRRR